jgi:glutamyl-tRNA synthetase
VDFKKLENLNGHYMRLERDEVLADGVVAHMAREGLAVTETERARLLQAMPGLKERAKTVVELATSASYLFARRPLAIDAAAAKILTPDARKVLAGLHEALSATNWTVAELEAATKAYAESAGLKLGLAAQPLRAALTGKSTSPGIFDVLFVLGREESLARIKDQVTG